MAACFSYAVVEAHNGCLHLEIEVTGKSAHAAIPFTGIDALEATTSILAALYSYRKSLSVNISATPGIGSPQLTVGLISGGINTNVVPDRVTVRLDRRMIPEDNPQNVEDELRRVIAEAAKAHPHAKVSVRRVLLARPLTPTPASKRLSEVIRKHATAVFGEAIEAKGVPLYTDARLYAEQGIPTVIYGAGPKTLEEANGHRADEKLKLSDLQKATEVIALTLTDLLD